jgi:hypothetical protein
MNADPDPQHCHKPHKKEGSTLRIKAVILLTIALVMSLHTVISFVCISAKFGICTVISLNGKLFEAKIRTFRCPKCVLASTSAPLKPTTEQMPNYALIETKRISVQ